MASPVPAVARCRARRDATIVVVSNEEEAVVIIVIAAIVEGAPEIALCPEHDLVPLPVIAPLAADKETEAVVVVAVIAEGIGHRQSGGRGSTPRFVPVVVMTLELLHMPPPFTPT